MKKLTGFIAAFLLLTSAAMPVPALGAVENSADIGNGYFRNPVLFGDFPDPDVILADDTYYMISTTMHHFPGATILKSKDLVHWTYCSNPLGVLETTDAYNLLNGENRYSRGQWATSLKYKDGMFYILFSTLDEGGYLLTSDNPEGNWKVTSLKDAFYDNGLLFDGDDTYVVYGINELRVARLDADFNKIEDKTVVKWSVREGLEGSRFYHIGDYYYIYSTYGGADGMQTVFRSKDPFGPYEEKLVLHDQSVHQGALVPTATGEWWTILFADRGALGRLPYLLPVKWQDGWPVIGNNGKVMETCKCPATGASSKGWSLPTTDPFRSNVLGMQWEWNHNPDGTRWSLTERPGFMRLYTATVTDDPYKARNTLTQRVLVNHNDKQHNYGTIKLDISGMADGDIAGLGVFQDPQTFIGVQCTGTEKRIVLVSSSLTSKIQKTMQAGPEVHVNDIYLRAVVNYDTSKAAFYYSFDNKSYKQMGGELAMQYDLSVFVGNRFAVFNYSTKSTGGYVDVDWFSTKAEFDEDTVYGPNFKGYDESALKVDRIEVEGLPESGVLTLLTGSSATLRSRAVYNDGHTQDITMAATVGSSDGGKVATAAGRVTAVADGSARVVVSYNDATGAICRHAFDVEATTFPFITGLFNPSIWGSGTFDQDTHTITTGQYGFAGWRFNAGTDLTRGKYIVARMKGPNQAGVSFRLFDKNDYWSDAAEIDFGNNSTVSACTSELVSAKGRKLDATHIYIAGFWSYGGTPFTIEKVYLTDNDDLSENSGVESPVIFDGSKRVDVYSLDGVCVRRQVEAMHATEGISPGFYIVGRDKVVVR